MKSSEKSGKTKMSGKDKVYLLLSILVVVALINVIVVLDPFEMWGSGAYKDIPGDTDQLTGEVIDTGPIKVSTDEYELTYSRDMEEIVTVRKVAGAAGTDIEFYAALGMGETLAMTMRYNSTDGDVVIEIADDSGGKIPFAFDMHDLPLEAAENDEFAFYATQELVNELGGTIVLK